MKSLIAGLMLSAFVVGIATLVAKGAEQENAPLDDGVEEVQLSQLSAKQQAFVAQGFAVTLVF